jgi:hypothetical protein
MANFGLTTGSGLTEIVAGLNYALSTVGSGGTANAVVSNSTTGVISNHTSGAVIGYLYRYLFVRYAQSANGSTNFSSSPTNATYYGLRNVDTYSPSSNPADYVWYQVAGGFGTTKFLYYSNTGGRQVQFTIATTSPGGTYVAATNTIDLNNLTVNNTQATAAFQPSFIGVPMAGSPSAPVFTGITPKVIVTANNTSVPFVSAQTDTDSSFTNNTWRIGGTATGGYGNILTSNITIGNPSLANTYYAQFPAPTAINGTNGFIAVPARYKDNFGVIYQLTTTEIQLAEQTPGLSGYTITSTPFISVAQQFGGTYPTTTFYANAQVTNTVETLTKSQPFTVNNSGVITFGSPTGSANITVTTSQTNVTFTHTSGTATTLLQVGSTANIANNSYQYPNQYLIIRYGTNITGAGITPNPSGKQFIGLYSSINPIAAGSASAYTWYDLGSPLSSTNQLFVRNLGNRCISIKLGSSNPDSTTYNTLYDINNSNPYIDLDNRSGFLLTQAYTAGGSNYLTAVTGTDGTITYLLPNGTSQPGLTSLASIAALNVDAQGRLTGFVATDKIYFGQASIVATGANITIDFTHINGQLLVFMNGMLLDASDYVEGAGTVSATVRIPNSYNGAVIQLMRFSESSSDGNTTYVPFTRVTTTSVAGQTVYSATYTQTGELLFWNGVFMNDADYDYSQGPNTFKILNTYPRHTGDIFTIISFRVLNNNTVPFGQAAGGTTAGSVSVPMTGTITPNYTIVAKNGVMLTQTDYTPGTSAVTLANTALFTGEFLQSTSIAATAETTDVLGNILPLTGGTTVVTPTIGIHAMGAIAGTSAVQQAAITALQAVQPTGLTVMSIGPTLSESDGTGFPKIKHPPTLGEMIEHRHKQSQAQIDQLTELVHNLVNHIKEQDEALNAVQTPSLKLVVNQTRAH